MAKMNGGPGKQLMNQGGNLVLPPNWVGESFNLHCVCPEPSVAGIMALGMALAAWKRKAI